MSLSAKLPIFLLFCWAFTACRDPHALKDYHRGIVPPDSMEMLLVEVHLAESYRNLHQVLTPSDTLNRADMAELYRQLLKPYGVSPERFLASYAYYETQHPVVMDSLYSGVTRRLNERLTEQYR
jgi:hypothetical protein